MAKVAGASKRLPKESVDIRRLRRILSARGDVVEKPMIGGWCFMVNGRICCGVNRAGLLVHVGQPGRDRAFELPHTRPMKFAGKTLAGFISVEPEGYRTDRALAAWVQRGLPASAVEEGFASVVKGLAKEKGVTSRDGKGFGSRALKVDGKIFAMVSSRSEFVVKLPKERVTELVASGVGNYFDAGKGRPMKEWLTMADQKVPWIKLAREASRFVKSGAGQQNG